jgi:hypothetical protein
MLAVANGKAFWIPAILNLWLSRNSQSLAPQCMLIFTRLRIRLGTEQTVWRHLFSYIFPSLLHIQGRSNLGREDQIFVPSHHTTCKLLSISQRRCFVHLVTRSTRDGQPVGSRARRFLDSK